jgi:hypothetical protein
VATSPSDRTAMMLRWSRISFWLAGIWAVALIIAALLGSTLPLTIVPLSVGGILGIGLALKYRSDPIYDRRFYELEREQETGEN